MLVARMRRKGRVRTLRHCMLLALALAAGPNGLGSDLSAQEMTISPQFEQAGNFHRGVAPSMVGQRWGLINRSGAWVVRPRYVQMLPGGDGLFAVSEASLWGFIDTTGKTVIEAKFDAASPFDNGSAAVKSSARWGYVRSDGTMEIKFEFLDVGGREGAYVSARDAEGWAVFKLLSNGRLKRNDVTTQGRAYSISESTVIAQTQQGREEIFVILPDALFGYSVMPLVGWDRKYVSIRRMSEGFAPASTAPNKWGYLHKATGEFLWADRFQDASSFGQGFAPVKISGKWAYIDRAGRVIIEPPMTQLFRFAATMP